jgi:hypothetical protein
MARRAERREDREEDQAVKDRKTCSTNSHDTTVVGRVKLRVRENRRINKTNPRVLKVLNITVARLNAIPCNNPGREKAATTGGGIGQQTVGQATVQERRKEPKQES